jgi:hypothetical protein
MLNNIRLGRKELKGQTLEIISEIGENEKGN